MLSAHEARRLLNSIDIPTVIGLRDRALIAVMVYRFARLGAVVATKGADDYQNGIRRGFRLLTSDQITLDEIERIII